ncbi:hypothetical protein P8452_67671 [Trifolium repens]|nr:hypothetical protein P8452_67671 [Trifolium repens]
MKADRKASPTATTTAMIWIEKISNAVMSSSIQILICNSSTVGINKRGRVLPSSRQPPLKVRKKLSDIITDLHQLVAPFGKTDTTSVLYEAIGYIKFLYSHVEVRVNRHSKTCLIGPNCPWRT